MKSTHLLKIVHLVLLLTMVISITAIQPIEVQAAQFKNVITETGLEKAEHDTYVSNRLLIKFKDNLQLQTEQKAEKMSGINTLDALMEMQGVIKATPLIPQSGTKNQRQEAAPIIYSLELDGEKDPQEAAKALVMDPNIVWVEPDYIATAVLTPNDPDYSLQWGLNKIEAETAWDTETGSSAVVIAVIDSGIDQTHPDLDDQLWVNPGEIAGNGIDDDNNTYIDDIHGWNFIGGDGNISDINGHGTQVSGIAAAESNNGTAIAGVCWHCQIMPVRVMSGAGNANYSDVAVGVMYAADKGADVINLSLGGYSYSNALKEAIDYAVSKGVVVVAGAGNDNLESMFYPAAYNNVLAVAATDQSDLKAGYSNYGNWVDVSAPGVDIQTTFLGGDTGSASGSSLSSPFAAGLAGLIRSQHPDWSEVMVRNQIIQTADVIDSTNPTYAGKLGSGRINAAEAMMTPQPLIKISSVVVDGVVNGRPTSGNTVELVLALSNDWWDASNVNTVLSSSDPTVTINTNTAGYGNIPSGAMVSNSTPFRSSISISAGYNHVINFNLRVTANNGAYVVNFPFTITTRSADEHFCGTIAQNTVWTNDKIYLIDCNVGVAPGYTLTIEANTEIRFTGNYIFSIGGTLIAQGTESAPIKFIGKDDLEWNKINFVDNSSDAVVDAAFNYLSGSVLSHVFIDGAANGISCESASPYLDHLQLTGGGINCQTGNLTVGGVVKDSTGIIKNSNVRGNTLYSNNVFMFDNNFYNNVNIMGENYWDGNQPANIQEVLSLCNIQGNHFENLKISVGYACGFVENTVLNGAVHVGNYSVVQNNNIESRLPQNLIEGDDDIENWGVYARKNATVQNNRIVGAYGGVNVYSGLVEFNLIANTETKALLLENNVADGQFVVLVQKNSFTGNNGSSIIIRSLDVTLDYPKDILANSVTITQNNFENNFGTFDIENHIISSQLSVVDATQNWWGISTVAEINQRIFDFYDDFTIGQVNYLPILTSPAVDAPAYVRSVTLNPESPVGIQTVNFSVEFSKPMDASMLPEMYFYSTKKDAWEDFIVSKEENFWISDLVGHPNGEMWAATNKGAFLFNGSNWVHIENPLLDEGENTSLNFVDIHPDGSIWFALSGAVTSLYRYDGINWTRYDTNLSDARDMFIQNNGTIWFTTSMYGLIKFDGQDFSQINTQNSNIPTNNLYQGLVHPDGSLWLTIDNGILKFDGMIWKTYSFESDYSYSPDSLIIDSNNVLWTTFNGWLYQFDGNSWIMKIVENATGGIFQLYAGANGDLWWSSGGIVYQLGEKGLNQFSSENSGILSPFIGNVSAQTNGSVWFVYNSADLSNHVSVLYNRPTYFIQNNKLLSDETRWQSTYDFSSAIERGDYRFEISGAAGVDGMEIAPFDNRIFTVDYAGYIDDDTPPSKPIVEACSYTQVDKLSASWSVIDPESTVDLYRYAIGTTPGGTEVVNWTTTSSTSFVRTGLNLVSGKSYYISVQARNEGGLWSEAGTPDAVIAGTALCTSNISSVYLPLLTR